MVGRARILEMLRSNPDTWAPGQFASAQRHQIYLAASAEIERLELQLERAKTAALVDVARAAAAREDWRVAQEVLSYIERSEPDYPTLSPDSILDSGSE